MNEHIRPITKADLQGLKNVLQSSELFPSEYLDEMVYDYFYNGETLDLWFACFIEEMPIAIGYCVPEKLTEGTYNLLALGVSKDLQRMGIAGKMMAHIENHLSLNGGRMMIVETSSAGEQFAARAFYEKLGYSRVAEIADFWKEGEDKIIFLKRLSGSF